MGKQEKDCIANKINSRNKHKMIQSYVRLRRRKETLKEMKIFGKDLREIPQVVTFFFIVSLLNIFINFFRLS